MSQMDKVFKEANRRARKELTVLHRVVNERMNKEKAKAMSDAADRFYDVIGISHPHEDDPNPPEFDRRLACIRIERLEAEKEYYRKLNIKCRKEKRYPSQNEISTLMGKCPVHQRG